MISDFVKGKKKFDYSEAIQKGIAIHRAIDSYTDEHPVNKELKQLFRPAYGLYASPIMDVVHDHFLANHAPIFPTELSLMDFSQQTYTTLAPYLPVFPERFARMFPYMQKQNWLFHYRNLDGLRQSMGGLQRRALHITEMDTAFSIFTEHYTTLRKGFEAFFPELEQHVEIVRRAQGA
jgi:acyl carrier protein phosphodiesterase